LAVGLSLLQARRSGTHYRPSFAVCPSVLATLNARLRQYYSRDINNNKHLILSCNNCRNSAKRYWSALFDVFLHKVIFYNKHACCSRRLFFYYVVLLLLNWSWSRSYNFGLVSITAVQRLYLLYLCFYRTVTGNYACCDLIKITIAVCTCTGMTHAFGILGTVVAFIFGGFLLQLYTHFDIIDTST